MDRLAMLQQFVAQKPDDPFARYGLAMELNKRGMAAQANAVFVELMSRHPNYVPAYLMAGNALLAQGDSAGARGGFERGVAAGEAAGASHARGVLEAARAALD
jgi:cytochrome c-type biogenesis protein CcmH/NrfG